MNYDHRAIERKWQETWERDKRFHTPDAVAAQKTYYALDMFPYPSGAGLHVGHPRGFIATDVVARMKRAQGYSVLHPMGWDAFGLPAENYAIKTGIPPAQTTQQSIQRFRTQLKAIGLSYDWDREINTSSPEYYRWTQWLFLKLYERGLAYQAEAPVNWCPQDQTVLANEQVKDGLCDRCGSTVIQKRLKQWFFKTTEYANELISGLEQLDWPESIKTMQENWIGRSTGATITFHLQDKDTSIDVFTTRPETLYGVTYIVLAPEHAAVRGLAEQCENRDEIARYVQATSEKTELERKSETHEKTGVELKGLTATHPITHKPLPIWIADYVLANYGTGAVMAVPAHDDRDKDFAKTHNLDTLIVIDSDSDTLTNSGPWDGLHSLNDRESIIQTLVNDGVGKATTHYRLRDWLVSRQRYWGAPIPIIYCDSCGVVPVPESDLPVRLPEDVDFRPIGESPIARSESFHRHVSCPKCGARARRESDTMDTFVDSSWYYLRYVSPHSIGEPFDPELVRTWLPVDLYVGGAEHAVLHLLYARFVTKALADMDVIEFREPFQRLVNVGLIRAQDGAKMSKSKGNVINPDDLVEQYGADTLRGYEMFLGPFSDSLPWGTQGMVGIRRWLDRVVQLAENVSANTTDSTTVQKALAHAIEKVTSDIEHFKFNTAVSQLMILTNTLVETKSVSVVAWKSFLQLLAPFAPHLAHELWSRFDSSSAVSDAWPVAPEIQGEDQVTIVVQVNGKMRGSFMASPTLAKEELIVRAQALPNVATFLGGAIEPKSIVIPGRIVNFIIGGDGEKHGQ